MILKKEGKKKENIIQFLLLNHCELIIHVITRVIKDDPITLVYIISYTYILNITIKL